MVERWHLVLAAAALGAGVAIAIVDRWGPRFVSSRTVGLAGLAGALLGGWGNARWLPWLVPAAVVAVLADSGEPAHPLDRWVVLLTVVSLVGVWSAVPDTEAPLAAGCALAPIALMWAVRGVTVGPVGTVALVVAVTGPVWVGSAGWGAALATVVVVGMVAVAPVVAGFGADHLTGTGRRVVIGVHVAVALLVPRLLMRRSVAVATVGAVAVVAAELVVAWLARSGGADPDRLVAGGER